jgi:hypothetical protein
MYSERCLDFPCNARSLTRPALQSLQIFVVTHTLFSRLYVTLHLTATLLPKRVEGESKPLYRPNSMSPEKLGTNLLGYSALTEHLDIGFYSPGQLVVHLLSLALWVVEFRSDGQFCMLEVMDGSNA